MRDYVSHRPTGIYACWQYRGSAFPSRRITGIYTSATDCDGFLAAHRLLIYLYIGRMAPEESPKPRGPPTTHHRGDAAGTSYRFGSLKLCHCYTRRGSSAFLESGKSIASSQLKTPEISKAHHIGPPPTPPHCVVLDGASRLFRRCIIVESVWM